MIFIHGHGIVAIKPVSAYEYYSKNPKIQKEHPGFLDKDKFTNELKTNQAFYNKVTSGLWQKYLDKYKSPSRAAYAWRNGAHAAANASDKQIGEHPYVRKFNDFRNKLLGNK